MSDLSSTERLKFEALFGMESGYVLDFSNNTFSMFTIENVGVDIFNSKYEYGSSSKANRLRKFWLDESNEIVVKLLSALLEYWLAKKQISGEELSSKETTLYDECQKIVNRLNRNSFRQTQKNTSALAQKGRIFISYRRIDSAGYAGRIYDRLVEHFGEDAIFMDVDTIEGGTDFIKVLEDAVHSCEVLIALIGRQWLGIKDKDGKRRLDSPEDFVRIEIATALKRNIRVIPVLVDGVEMPQPTELPDVLMTLSRRNALQVNHHSFNPDVYRLIEHTMSALDEVEKIARQKAIKEQVTREVTEKPESELDEKIDIEAPAPPSKRQLFPKRKFDTISFISITAIVFCIASVILIPILGSLSKRSEPTPAPQIKITNTVEISSSPSFTLVVSEIPTLTSTPVITITPTPLPTEIKDAKGVTMRLVPAGEFIMGYERENDESPVHKIFLDAFYIDKYEVTNDLYRNCVEQSKCTPPTSGTYFTNTEYLEYPVVYVTWGMAKTYCEWRVGRLPIEAEWEKAARGENGRTYPWGEDIGSFVVNFCDKNCNMDHANSIYDDNFAALAPVGSYPDGVSVYGLYDMAGNIAEWVSNIHEGYEDNPLGGSDDENAIGPRVFRGGAWNSASYYIRTTSRRFIEPNIDSDPNSNGIGFRCVKDVIP